MRIGIFTGMTGGKALYEKYIKKYSELELIELPTTPAEENLHLIGDHGIEALIYYQPDKEPESWYKAASEQGLKYLVTPSKGFDHLNIPAMRALGMKGANVPGYSPNAISEYTILLLLALLRRLRSHILRVRQGDYSIKGLCGREIHELTVGVIGVGKIGAATVRALQGFGAKEILLYSHHEQEALKSAASYLPLNEVYARSDVLIFHCNYREENHHMVNAESLQQMRDGVILVNTARGALFDNEALIAGLKSGKIGGLALDVLEGEEALRSPKDNAEASIFRLLAMQEDYPLLFTNHAAFYTDRATEEVAEALVDNLRSYAQTGSCEYELCGD